MLDQALNHSQNDDRKFLEDLALLVRARKLEAPAIFLLESIKPLASVLLAAGTLSQPLLFGIFGKALSEKGLKVLESRKNLEILIGLIEQQPEVSA